VKKIASEIELCRKLWKYRSKESLPQIAHLRYRKSRCITIGKLKVCFPMAIFLKRGAERS
jgi:hypothetical protein